MPHMTARCDDEERCVIFLPHGLYITKKQCIAEMILLNILPPETNPETARILWKERLWNVRLREWQPFCKCDVCSYFKSATVLMMSRLKTKGLTVALLKKEADMIDLTIRRQAHLSAIQLARSRVYLRTRLAESFPDFFLSVCIDGMDNQKTNLPHLGNTFKHKQIDTAGMLPNTG